MSSPKILHLDKTDKDIHSLITPADIRSGEPIKCFITFGEKKQEVRVWRVSPLGLEIVKDHNLSEISEGTHIDIELFIGMNKTEHKGLIVCSEWHEEKVALIGLRFYSRPPEKWSGSERRTTSRWLASEDYCPTGVFANPARFNDFVFFKITDLSKDGMGFQTSLRNKFLIKGMELETTVSFPMIGTANTVFSIQNVTITNKNGKDILSVGCAFRNTSAIFRENAANYLLQFSNDIDYSKLKHEGMLAGELSKAVEFRFVKSKEEYEEVIELRKRAYGEAGKLNENSKVSDIFDSRARIIIGVFKGRIIASTRLIFNETEDSMEHDQFVIFKDDMPRKDEICEITRVCIDKEFRGTNVLALLLKQVGITVAQSGRKYILGCATDKLLPLYLKIGFRKTDYTYLHKDLNDLKHTVFLCNVHDVAKGIGVNPIVWNILWHDCVSFIRENRIVVMDPASNIRLGIYQLFKPLADLISWWSYRKVGKKRSTGT